MSVECIEMSTNIYIYYNCMCNLCIDFALNMKRKCDIIFTIGYLPLGVSMLFKCLMHRRQ